MEAVETEIKRHSHEILKDYLDSKGIVQGWIADNMKPAKTYAWISRILKGTLKLSEENKKQIEELLNITL